MSLDHWILIVSVTLLIAVIGFVLKFGRWQGEVDSDRKYFKEFMKEVRADLKEIRADIREIFSRLPPSPITSAGPLRLTELGKRISKNIEAASWAEKTAQNLVDKTKDMDSFQIQNLSFNKAEEFEPDKTLLLKMQDAAFQEGISLDGVRKVLAVELRDCLLKQNNLTRS